MTACRLFVALTLAALAFSPAASQTLPAPTPNVGAPAKPPTPPPAATKPASPTPATLLDINTAPKVDLEKLKGIGPARAEAIIKGRPFKSKDELVQKKIIPQNIYEGIKEQIIARQKN